MTVTIKQAERSLKALIEKTSRGETVVITQDRKPVAELRAPSAVNATPVFGSCNGALKMTADDKAHLDDFVEYMK